MSLDVSRVVSEMGDAFIAKVGEEVGLDGDLSVRAAHALAAHIGSGGRDGAIKQAAAETGVGEEVIAALMTKLVEAGTEKLLKESPVGDAIDSAKEQASAALGAVGGDLAKKAGGMLGGLFGRK
jgi:hypothetical protein